MIRHDSRIYNILHEIQVAWQKIPTQKMSLSECLFIPEPMYTHSGYRYKPNQTRKKPQCLSQAKLMCSYSTTLTTASQKQCACQLTWRAFHKVVECGGCGTKAEGNGFTWLFTHPPWPPLMVGTVFLTSFSTIMVDSAAHLFTPVAVVGCLLCFTVGGLDHYCHLNCGHLWHAVRLCSCHVKTHLYCSP
jgi:hypothetical protein